MKYFRSETYRQVRLNDENTESTVYRKIDRKLTTNKKEPAFADSYIKQYDLRGIFDEKRLDEIF